MRILFAEDDPKVLDLAKILREKGHTVTAACNLCDAEEALMEQEKNGDYNAVILDLNMSISDLPRAYQKEAKESFTGWVFYKYILKQYTQINDNVIFLTAYDSVFHELLGEEVKGITVIGKGNRDILNKIDKALYKFEKAKG